MIRNFRPTRRRRIMTRNFFWLTDSVIVFCWKSAKLLEQEIVHNQNNFFLNLCNKTVCKKSRPHLSQWHCVCVKAVNIMYKKWKQWQHLLIYVPRSRKRWLDDTRCGGVLGYFFFVLFVLSALSVTMCMSLTILSRHKTKMNTFCRIIHPKRTHGSVSVS